MASYWILYSLLTEGTIQVRVRTVTSQAAGVPAGVTQGSILSPILYNSYTADLYDDSPPHVKILGYSDDLGLYSHSSSQDKDVQRVSNTAYILLA